MSRDEKDQEREAYRRSMSRISQRKRRAEAREKGLCVMCCRIPARMDRKTCADCCRRSGEWQKRKRNETK